MTRKWDAGEALKIIEQEKVTRFTGVPTMVKDMLEHPTYKPEAFSSMKNISAGGAPVPPALLSQMRKNAKSAGAAQGYGLTETMGGVIVNSGVDYLKHPSSCGKPIPFVVEAAIKDPATGKVLPAGSRGELCIRSVFNMKCYNNREEDTKKAIDSEGFFHTGDVAKIEGGFVYILDRLKDIIIRGGENIDCSEVEAVLYSHPSVRECSVFGLPDARLGEVVGVVVWPKGPLTAAELSTHAASGKLAKFKVPLQEHIFLVDEALPKGATGKIDKKGIREQYKGQLAGPPQSKM
jgi:acyl-CoA synthetase (AMP-forming)/AMP-acid ligase II